MLYPIDCNVLCSGVEIGGSAGSRNRGPRPLGAPDCGHNLFYLQDAKIRIQKKPKSAHSLSPRLGVLEKANERISRHRKFWKFYAFCSCCSLTVKFRKLPKKNMYYIFAVSVLGNRNMNAVSKHGACPNAP